VHPLCRIYIITGPLALIKPFESAKIILYYISQISGSEGALIGLRIANILIICSEFPPLNSIASRRMYAWARYLPEYGHKVYVLTPKKECFSEMMSFEPPALSFSVIENKYPDLRKLVQRPFKKNMVAVEITGTASYKREEKKGWLAPFFGALFRFGAGRGILFSSILVPNFLDLWIWPAVKKGKQIIEDHNIEVLLTSYPSPSVPIIGYFLKKKFKKLIWVTDYRDLWTMNPMMKGLFLFSRLERFIETRCLKRADLVITVSGVLGSALRKLGAGDKVSIIENGYDEHFLPRLLNPQKTRGRKE
jgi:hypothetical protein